MKVVVDENDIRKMIFENLYEKKRYYKNDI